MYGVVTQGRMYPLGNQRVTSYTVQYSMDCVKFDTVKNDSGNDMVLYTQYINKCNILINLYIGISNLLYLGCHCCHPPEFRIPRELILPTLHPPRTIFMSAKSFMGTPEIQRVFVLKDKRVCKLVEKCMVWVSMAIVNVILEQESYPRYYIS